jgi:hypothetical protein
MSSHISSGRPADVKPRPYAARQGHTAPGAATKLWSALRRLHHTSRIERRVPSDQPATADALDHGAHGAAQRRHPYANFAGSPRA